MVRKLVTVIDGRIVPEMENDVKPLTGEEREDMSSKFWDDTRDFLRADWQADVDAGKTKLGYQDWFAQQFPTGEAE
jgi:hypothetical protein